MRLSSRKLDRRTSVELSMTSMIDVVFLLLIFFVTTASFQQTERDLESAVQRRSDSAGAKSEVEPAIVTFDLRGDEWVFRVGGQRFATNEELAEFLRGFPRKGDGAYVKVTDDVPFAMAAAAVQACRDARFPEVVYVPSK